MNQERADRWEVEAGDVLAQALVDLPEGPRIPVELQVAHGRPAEVLTAAARPACLLVVGRGRAEQHGVGPHAGPVPAALVHDAACPVALLPPGLDVPSTGPAVMHELGRAGQLA